MFGFIRNKMKPDTKPEKDDPVCSGAAAPVGAPGEESSVGQNGDAPQSEEIDGITVFYQKTMDGTDSVFYLHAACYWPPEEQFRSCLSDSERKRMEVIWLLCLFCRNGIELLSEPAHVFDWGCATWTYQYELSIHGIPTLMSYENYAGVCFLVAVEHADKRKSVVRAICDLIVREGRSVTYADWTKLQADGRIEL